MAQLWQVLVPEAGTNIVENPSAERDGNYSVAGATTVTRSNAFAYSGFYSYLVTFAATDVFSLDLSTPLNGQYVISMVVKGTTLTNIQIETDTGWQNLSAFTVEEGAITDPNGARIYKYFDILGGALSTLNFRTSSGSATLYIDSVMIDNTTNITTYIDGDQPGAYWNGARHGSSSTRTATSRAGGRFRNLEDYSLTVSTDSNRFGMPPITNNIQSRAIQPGADFLSSRILPREINLILSANGSSLANLHVLRQQAIDLFGPARTGDSQPVIMAYTGANSTRRAYGKFHYGSGLEFNGVSGFLETIPLRLLAVDPFWYEAGNVTQALSFTNTVSSTRLSARTSAGVWAALGGLNSDVYVLAFDPERNRTYIGGAFTTGNSGGTTLNYVAYFDGLSGPNQLGTGGAIGTNGTVRALAIAPNGDVWVGGDFTQAGGVAADKLALWSVSANTWTQFTFGGATVNSISVAATDENGLLYMGGDFQNVGGANGDFIVAFDGTTVTALSTGANNPVRNIVVASDGNIYVSGAFTSIGGVSTTIAKWNGSAFTSLGSITAAVYRNTLFEAPDRAIYCASTTALYRYTGNTLIELYDFGVNIGYITPYLNGTVLISLVSPTTIFGGSTYHLIWNGTAFVLPDFISLAGFGQFASLPLPNNALPQNDIQVMMGHNGVTLSTGGAVTAFTNVSTTETYPVVLITGPTTAGASCRLKWLENLTTGERCYFSLLVSSGESVIIDFRPGARGVYSAWGGRPAANSPAIRSVSINGGGLNPGAWRAVSDNPLGASDFAAWNLASGANTIIAYISGTVTGVTCTLAYTPVHYAVDGVA